VFVFINFGTLFDNLSHFLAQVTFNLYVKP